ncbi:MAG: ribokinase [Pseudomonadota bacterium]
MTILNIGSINIDTIFRVSQLPKAGETMSARSVDRYLGGKGANQSIAIARAGGTVSHIGAVGEDGPQMLQEMENAGVDIQHVKRLFDTQTGQAFIAVDDSGENTILLDAGANAALDVDAIGLLLSKAANNSMVLLQNETNGIVELARQSQLAGHKVIWSAAPFDAQVASALAPFTSLTALNRIEYDALDAAGIEMSGDILVTDGAKGALYRSAEGDETHVDAIAVTPVDTTGAGDTFLGTFLARRQQGVDIPSALQRAALTAALHVTRHGTASAIPSASEVENWKSQ